MADVVGTAVDGMRLPLPKSVFTKKKTLPGTLAMFVSSVVGSVGLLAAARLALPFATVVAASAGAAVAELLPVDDNMPVPLAAYFIVKALKL